MDARQPHPSSPAEAPAPARPPGLEDAIARYERTTGERADRAQIDLPGTPPVLRAYRSFSRAPFRIPFRPAAGEELALRLGLKPVLRLLTAPARVPRLTAYFRKSGFATLSLPQTRRESGVDGALSSTPVRLPDTGDVLFYAGRAAAHLEEAARLDLRMALNVMLAPEEMAQATRRLGELLGYPPCCVEAFVALGPPQRNVEPIRAAAARSAAFDALLDNVSLSAPHLVAWFPCRYDCEPSLEVARAVAQGLATGAPAPVAALRRYLAMPRLYCDDRRQILFDGELRGDRSVRYRTVHSPYAFDRRTDEAAYEWVFFASVIAPLLDGEEVTMEPDELVIERRGASPARVPRPRGSVWLPFREGA